MTGCKQSNSSNTTEPKEITKVNGETVNSINQPIGESINQSIKIQSKENENQIIVH